MRKGNSKNKIFKILAILFIALFWIKTLPQTAIKVFIRTNPLMNIGTQKNSNLWIKAESQDIKQNIEKRHYYYYSSNDRDITADMKKYILDNINYIYYTHLGSRGVSVGSSNASFSYSDISLSGAVYSSYWSLFSGNSDGSGEDFSGRSWHGPSCASSCNSSTV